MDKKAKQIYDKIRAQNGLADLKALIRKWEALSEHLEGRPVGMPIILPDLLLVSRSGTGRTHVLRLLSEYLATKPCLMDFYGDVPYFEFMLNYCSPGEYFSEIQRLMVEVSNATGFRSEYRGIVYIDIDEWRGHMEEKHFISFMEYLSDNSDDWLVVLSVSDDDPEQLCRMEAFLSAYIRMERIVIEPPTVAELTEYAEGLLDAYGIRLRRDARQLLSESIGVLCGNRYFDGYKSVKMLCEDIAYALYAEGFDKRGVRAADVERYAADGEYVQRMVVTIEKTHTIGF